MPSVSSTPKTPRRPALAAGALAGAIAVCGILQIRAVQWRFREQAEAQLAAVADLKVSQIAGWRQGQLADAAILSDDRLVARELKSVLTGSRERAVRDECRTWLDSLAAHRGYTHVVLADAEGRVVAAVGKGPQPPAAHVAAHVADALRLRKALFADIESGGEGGSVHLDLISPIVDPDRPRVVLGALLLGIDPGADLYPLIQRWPTQSASAELILARVQGRSVVFLNTLRHRGSAPLSLRVPLAGGGADPAVRFALGEQGIVTGTDYRGVEVLAAGRAIPNAPWFIVAKVDAQELLAPGSWEAAKLGLIFLLLMASAVGSVALWCRHQTALRHRSECEHSRHQAELLENLNDAVVGLDAQHVIHSWNPAAERVFGVAAHEALGKRMCDVVPCEYRGYSFGEFVDVLDRSGRMTYEVRHTLPNGGFVDVEAAAVALRSEDEEISGFVIVNRDVTFRRRAEAALRNSQERLARILETSSEGIWIVDLQGRTEFLNQRGAQLFGITPAEAAGRPHVDLIPETGRPYAQADLDSMLRGSPVKREFSMRRKDGSEVWINLSWTALHDADGRVCGGVGLFMDVTAHRGAREQLLQAQKMDAVGRLAAGVAHDFNNLLVSILSCSGFLLESLAEGDPRREEAEEIKKAGERAARLVRQLLAFARKSAFTPVPVDVNLVVRRIETILRRAIGADVVVTFSLGASWPTFIDPGHLEQVIMNLAVNARDAMPAGGRIRIETGDVTLEHPPMHDQRLKPGRYAVLTVADTGCGIRSEVLPRIFEPFFTTKEEGRGTGLGLSTVYGIVSEAGGTIAVSSELGGGTTFKVYLPACRGAESAAASSPRPSSPAGPPVRKLIARSG